MSTATSAEPTQAEQVKAILLKGQRPTKWGLRQQLRIENVGGRIADVRAMGLPVATLWIDRYTGKVCRGEDGRPLVWYPDTIHSEVGWSAHTHQPSNAVAAYQLYCTGCKAIEPEKLGWTRIGRDPIGPVYELAEFAPTFLCPPCLADEMCST